MSDKFIGIIGGSGIYKIDEIEIVDKHTVETPFGMPSDQIVEGKYQGHHFFFLPRHGEGHTIMPSEINYRANIFAMKKLGVKNLISVSAVGSLKEELPPTMFVLPSQFIDWTKGLRDRTFFGKGIVGHVSTAVPVEANLQNAIEEICKKTDVKCSKGGSYVCIEGPQFSSKAESAIYRSFGASVIGMTNIPEAYLAKEAGMAYATIAMVTDYDCWKDEHCSVAEILKTMETNNKSAKKVILELIPRLYSNPIEFSPENQYAVITDQTKITEDQKSILKVLLS